MLHSLHVGAEGESAKGWHRVTQELDVIDVERAFLQVDSQAKMLQPLNQNPEMSNVLLWWAAGHT